MHYRETIVWNKAMALALEIYRLIPGLPKEEIYGMRSQITRAVVSVPANIAEGWTRESPKEKMHFLSITQGSLAEMEALLRPVDVRRDRAKRNQEARKGSIMEFYVGLTDYDWFSFLRDIRPDDVNFWKPSGQPFSAIVPGAPFLFKLKAPINKIGGVGFFSTYKPLPLSIAWDAFAERNGCGSFRDFKKKIELYKKKNKMPDEGLSIVGCVILTDPVFFSDEELFDQPEDWSGPIVTGKKYSTDSSIGAHIWDQIQERLAVREFYMRESPVFENSAFVNEDERYRETLSKVRIGQGAFRIMVTSAYENACAITGDHTLPVLEAAHIKPFALSGPHLVSNGILLRSDLHKLFDSGYLTITKDYHVEVSPRIREEYNNGKEYYSMHGKKLMVTPQALRDRPSIELLRWHNENSFMAS